MPPASSTFHCPRCGESLPAGSSRCDACGAYLVGAPAAGTSTSGRKPATSKASPPSAGPGNAGLFLILGLIIGGAIGYALHGAAGPRAEGGMPRGPADVMRGSAAAGDDGAPAMGGGMGAGDAGAGGMGGGTPPQMPPQVVAMVQKYREALAKDPNDVDANIGFGNLLFDSSQWEKAADHYGRALAKAPGNVDARVDRAIALHNLDRNDEALKELQRATREQPTHKNAWLNLGVISATLGDKAGAIAAWEQYLKLDPSGEHADAIRAQIEELKKAS